VFDFKHVVLRQGNQCSSRSNALLFSSSGEPAHVTTRDLDLSDGTPQGTDVPRVVVR